MKDLASGLQDMVGADREVAWLPACNLTRLRFRETTGKIGRAQIPGFGLDRALID